MSIGMAFGLHDARERDVGRYRGPVPQASTTLKTLYRRPTRSEWERHADAVSVPAMMRVVRPVC